ncbi:MAG: FxsA family protein [Thiotrichales bacterium]|nr:FxsA family protein [Thiotrichales bacterium]
MLKVFFLLFLLIPLVELYVLIQVGSVIGALPTVLLTIATALAGVVLMRTQGLATMQKAQVAMNAGTPPQMELMEGVFIFLGGVFLFVPGLISDAIGLMFLIPFVRQFLIKQSLKGTAMRGGYQYKNNKGDYYEGEWSEAQPKQPRSLNNQEVIEGEVIDSDKNQPK